MMNAYRKLVLLAVPLILFLSVRIAFSPDPYQKGNHPAGMQQNPYGQYRLFSPQEKMASTKRSAIDLNQAAILQGKIDIHALGDLASVNPNDFSIIHSSKFNSAAGEKSKILLPVKSGDKGDPASTLSSLHLISSFPETESADTNSEMSLESLSQQSFDAYYASLFSNRTEIADGSQRANSSENPFADALTASQEHIPSATSSEGGQHTSSSGNHSNSTSGTGTETPVVSGGNHSGSTASGSRDTAGESVSTPSGSTSGTSAGSSSGSGTTSGGTSAGTDTNNTPGTEGSSNPSQGTNEPSSGNNPSTNNPTTGNNPPNETSGGTTLKASGSFVVIGDLKWNGSAEIVPAIRFQDGRYEIPFLGMVQVKTFVVPDPYFTLKSVVIEDINNDTLPDILCVSGMESKITVVFGLPTGDFAAGPVLKLPVKIKSAAVFDFNSDRYKDLAVVEENGTNLSLFTGNGKGVFTYSVTWQMPISVNMASIGDVNSDTIDDIFATSLAQNYRTWSLKGLAGGGLEPNPFNFSYTPTAVQQTDILFNGITQKIVLFQWGKQMNVASGLGGTQLRHLAGSNLGMYRCVLILGDIRGKEHIDLGVGIVTR